MPSDARTKIPKIMSTIPRIEMSFILISMQTADQRTVTMQRITHRIVLMTMVSLLAFSGTAVRPAMRVPVPEALPDRLSDEAFWKLIGDLSEPMSGETYPGGDNFTTNEPGYQQVIPELLKVTKPGGVYLGVAPEQNFTYIAALRPKIAFIIDIRVQNMMEHLLYKMLF